MRRWMDLCTDDECNRVAGHKGEHSPLVEYRQVKHHPFHEVAENMTEQITKKNAICFQIWTCERCGARQQMERANAMFTEGVCENCEHVTNLERTGCNFLLMMPLGTATRAGLVDLIRAAGFRPPQDN